jgi:hypothetical protein
MDVLHAVLIATAVIGSLAALMRSTPPVASGRQGANEASRTAGSRRETYWEATGRPAFETAVAW